MKHKQIRNMQDLTVQFVWQGLYTKLKRLSYYPRQCWRLVIVDNAFGSKINLQYGRQADKTI